MVTEQRVLQALSQVQDPELGRDVVSLGMIRNISIEGGKVHFDLALTVASCPMRGQLVQQAHDAVACLEGVREVEVRATEMTAEERERLFAGLRQQRPQPRNRIRHTIAVMSGKGGVGKSLVSALLAVALRRQGNCVGLLDADITGPSIPRMFFAEPRRPQVGEEGLEPVVSEGGIKVMSINLILPDEGDAVIWRGPLISGAIRQFWDEVVWGDLDYLVIDLPPGTSDASLTVVQSIPLNGVVLVTSPQALSGMVVRKAASMARQMEVPIVGIVENMAYVKCPGCDEIVRVFGPSHSEELARTLGTELLGSLPLEPDIATLADSGRIEQYPAEDFVSIAERVAALLPTRQTRPMVPKR